MRGWRAVTRSVLLGIMPRMPSIPTSLYGGRRVATVLGIVAVLGSATLVAPAGCAAATEGHPAGRRAPGAEATADPLPDPTVSIAAGRPTGVRYDFDGGLSDRSGILPLHAVSAGGAIEWVDRAGGRAVRFPRPCAHYGAPGCARAVLESGPAPFLNPGTGPIRFGARIQMAAEEASKGANIVQKGYSLGRSQYKLQVDGLAGKPSCVLVGVDSSQIYGVTADRSVSDGRWHQVDCVREGGSLTVVVDEFIAGSVAIPTTLSVENDDPLRVGGKGGSANNDQFNGVLDDVYVHPGPQ
jgi:Concanavalin A-like lectin/glucanases superfamily